MADDFVELGLEVLDRFTDKYHDKFHDTIYRRIHKSKGTKDNAQSQSADLPPPRTQSEPGLGREGDFSDDGSDRDYDYAPRERRQSEYHDDGPRDRDMSFRDDRPRESYRDRDRGYIPPAGGASDCYGRPRTIYTPSMRSEYRGRENNAPYGYGAPAYQAPLPPPPFAPQVPAQLQCPNPYPQMPPSLEDSLVTARRRQSLRTVPRSPSHSPPRNSRSLYAPRATSPRRRRRSKSPPSKGFASSVVGALAGGLVGNELNKGDTLTTVAAAVIGAVGVREAEKQWDKRKEREKEDNERWERRWERERK